MPIRYRLLQNHPYAKAGTIVDEYERKDYLGRVEVIISDVQIINIPLDVEHEWLEEVKEDVTFTKEQADAIKAHAASIQIGLLSGYQRTPFEEWLDDHTSKDN